MNKPNRHRAVKIVFALVAVLAAAISPFAMGCGGSPLDPKNPVTITVWHYYGGAISTSFDSMVQEFNETVGKREGVIVEGVGRGSTSELEKAVMASAKNEVGSDRMPNVFSAYADTAYEIEKMGLLADLGEYFSVDEQAEYLDSYIEEGRIGLNGELRIFPIAKSTETFVLNVTDFTEFAEARGFTLDDLKTLEGLTEVSASYYDWTDAKTPGVAGDGKAFFGRDAMANLFIIASKEFDTEIFQVSGGKGTVNLDAAVMKRVWDNYYVPYISGHFYSSGSFRSEDAKTGSILSYIGSTASANYAPTEVTSGGVKHPIDVKVLPMPHFIGGKNVQIQQGGGMVVSKAEKKYEYASVLFLKWFTEVDNNSVFAAMNGYLPVKKAANNYQSMINAISASNISISNIADETLRVSFEAIENGTLYANKAFDGGMAARKVLDSNLQSKAIADRAAILNLIASGTPQADAIKQYNTTQNFNTWLQSLKSAIVL